MSSGGKKAASIKKIKTIHDSATLAASIQGVMQGSISPLVDNNKVKQIQNRSIKKGFNKDPWVEDYEKASNGE
jgi:tryptophan synthase beta subunit